MKAIYSLNELISVLEAFPLKSKSLNEKSTLKDSINLFGSLMLQRVRSVLIDYYPNSDLRGLTENSNLKEILLILNQNRESSNNQIPYNEDLGSNILPQVPQVLTPNLIKNETVSVGIDIESIHAFPSDTMLPSGASFRSRTFCPREIAYASTKNFPLQTLLGIFCAKEAVIKCCTDVNSITFRDIEITYDSKGRPLCNLRNHAGLDFKVSISHSSDYACAFALMTHSLY